MSSSALRKPVVLPSQSRASRPKIDLQDRTTWTVEFCTSMKRHFSGDGQGDIYSWWERCRRAIEVYTEKKNKGENIGHPLTSAYALGKDRVLIRALQPRESRTAYSLSDFEVS